MHWLSALPLRLAQGKPQMLLTVVRVQGSAPREAGAAMLVDAEDTTDTIGGGHLEWEAITVARGLLAAGPALTLLRFNLGASLGQCCGGVVWLLLERIAPEQAGLWRQRAEAVKRGAVLHRRAEASVASLNPLAGSEWRLDMLAANGQCNLQGGLQGWQLEQILLQPSFPVWLFGAGHVGAALIKVLQPLGAQICWVDNRDDAFQADWAWAVNTIVTDSPEAEVDAAPAGCYFLVMTHNHTLDLQLCERIFRRQDHAYFGLIGSRSKRASFEHRLLERGVKAGRLAEMTCPIGVAGVLSKQPEAIAISVAAQLLQVRDARALLAQVGPQPRAHDASHQESP
ncbi:xanthine dehydrogenase accessory protein XdhC [Chitinimonas naiadis]